jgi:hypothetical protein
MSQNMTIFRKLVDGQWFTTNVEKIKHARDSVQKNRIYRISSRQTRSRILFHPDILDACQYSHEELLVFSSVIKSERISQGQLIPCAWIPECELYFQHDHELVLRMIARGYLDRWINADHVLVVTLTPWSAWSLGYKIGEVLIRWYQQEIQYVGNRYHGMTRKKVKILRHDYESYWIPAGWPERRQRSVLNLGERPLDNYIDTIHEQDARKYYRDQDMNEFTDNATEAYRIMNIPVAPLRKPGPKPRKKYKRV